jgi:glucosamine--fructose-6-phosphate aminotransferase (isomerizing)
MCGVFGYIGEGKSDLSGFLIDGLTKLEYRGYDSAGIAILQKNKFKVFKKIGEIKNLKKLLSGKKISGKLGIGHTRWATHGGVTDRNSHPHLDCGGNIAVVHNGIVENFEDIKKLLIQKGHKFTSETDTEVIPHLIEEETKDNNFLEAVRKTFLKLYGLNAIVALGKNGEMVAFKNGSPLVIGLGEEANFISSDIPALLSETKEIVFLNEKEGVMFSGKDITVLDAQSGKTKKVRTEKISMDEIKEDKGDFAHFMLKEIYEQPEVVARVASNERSEFEEISKMIKDAWGTYFTACGTAGYAGLAATYMFSEIAGRHINFSLGSEFPYFEDFLVPRSLLIAASQSGETMDTLEAVRAAKRHGSKVLALVNVPGSTLSRLADVSFMLKAGPERAVVSTKAYIAKISTFLLLAHTLAGKYAQGIKVLKKASNDLREMLTPSFIKNIKALAFKLRKENDVYVIGRGVNYATSLEGALKLKEASYIHAEGLPGGELKHGTIALIEKGTFCIAVIANDRAKAEVLSNAAELKSRGAYLIGISPESHKIFDYFIKVPDVGTASPLINVVPLQLLAYYVAIARGINPDKPRNLAKSVTVK